MPEPKKYAMISHESAVEAIWSLAARGWQGVLDDENVWMVPEADWCVHTQGDLRSLASNVDLNALGIRRRPVDLLVPNKSCYSRGKLARFHVWSDFFPPRSLVRVHDLVFISTPYFTTLQMALARRPSRGLKRSAQTAAEEDSQIRRDLGLQDSPVTTDELIQWGNIERFVRAVQVLCDFLGTYRYVPEADKTDPSEPDIVFNTKPIVSLSTMETFLGDMPAMKGVMRARRVMDAAFEGAASPMETMLALMLSLPTAMGGFGLPRPILNYEIRPEVARRDLSSQDVMLADLCWPEHRLVAEYHGWDEHFGAGPGKVGEDAARANSLTALGWTVLHVTYEQVRTFAGMTLLARQVAHGLDMPLPKATDLELMWRVRLLAMLLPTRGDGR